MRLLDLIYGRRTRVLRAAARRASKFYGGPPFGREPVSAPSLWDANRANRENDADRLRAAVVRARRAVK